MDLRIAAPLAKWRNEMADEKHDPRTAISPVEAIVEIDAALKRVTMALDRDVVIRAIASLYGVDLNSKGG